MYAGLTRTENALCSACMPRADERCTNARAFVGLENEEKRLEKLKLVDEK